VQAPTKAPVDDSFPTDDKDTCGVPVPGGPASFTKVGDPQGSLGEMALKEGKDWKTTITPDAVPEFRNPTSPVVLPRLGREVLTRENSKKTFVFRFGIIGSFQGGLHGEA
jgi:hypothetical protein